MAVLELYMVFEGVNLIEHIFYTSNPDKIIDKSIRDNLMQAVVGLTQEAFNDQIKNFCIGEYEIIVNREEVEKPGETDVKKPVLMYVIAECDTNKKKIKKCMDDAMFQFLNRFSRIDIFAKNKDKFKEFSERFDKIFDGLIEKAPNYEEQMKEAQRLNRMQKKQRELREKSYSLGRF